MKVLVTNGRKINSFALTLECASFFANSGNDVTLIDGNPFVYPFTVRKKTQDKISSVNQIKIFGDFTGWVVNVLKAAIHANSWCQKATKSATPWEETALDNRLPLGRLVKSLIARSMGSSNFLLSDCRPSQVYEIAFKSIYSYLQTAKAISRVDSGIGLGIAHGGRDAYSAGAICAFREMGIETRLIESGGIPSRWSMFATSPHFSPDFWSRLQRPNLEVHPKEEISHWWEQRLAGSDHFRAEEWGHTRTTGLLPHNLPKEYISFFTTSDFEIPVFEEFDVFPGEFSNQTEAFMSLYEVARENNIHLVIRRHPNSVDQHGLDRETSLWANIRDLAGVTYLGPHEKVDSISLARSSRTVFTFKSSVGIEAIWLGVPAFALGPARWAWNDELRAWNMNRLREVVEKNVGVNREHSVRWANMMLNMDFPNSQFEKIHGNNCLYQGIAISNSRFENFADKFLVEVLRKTSQLIS